MRFSYKHLQEYFESPLPPRDELAEKITLHAFEVEVGEGDELDIKILPDRAADAKTELGLARELSAITGVSLKAKLVETPSIRAKIAYTAEAINGLLGLELGEFDIATLLARVRVKAEDGVAHIPADRVDLNLVEDLADEVGRLYGVYRIPAKPLPSVGRGTSDALVAKADVLRARLLALGYSEVYGYMLAAQGERRVLKPLAADKAYLRANLTDGLSEKITHNLQHNLFDEEPVKLFEVGTVFTGGQEVLRLAVGIGYRHKKYQKERLPDFVPGRDEQIREVDLDKINVEGDGDLAPYIHLDRRYVPFSPYPRIVRDVAVWVPAEVAPAKVQEIIRLAAGELLAEGPVQFDEFKKESRISLAFRLALQSGEKTLSDDEANAVMSCITTALEKEGWEVRK